MKDKVTRNRQHHFTMTNLPTYLPSLASWLTRKSTGHRIPWFLPRSLTKSPTVSRCISGTCFAHMEYQLDSNGWDQTRLYGWVWSPASSEVPAAFMRGSVLKSTLLTALLLIWTVRKTPLTNSQTLANCRNKLYTEGHDHQRDLNRLKKRLTRSHQVAREIQSLTTVEWGLTS